MATMSEADIEGFIAKLKDAPVESKVNLVQLWGIKLESCASLPPTALDALTLTLAPLLRSPSHLLLVSTLGNFLPFYLPLLPASPPHHVRLALSSLLPALLERLGAADKKVHGPAAACIEILGRKSYEADAANGAAANGAKGKEKESAAAAWEAAIKEALGGKASRAKLEAMRVLASLRAQDGTRIPLKPWLAPLVELLEDGDGAVRDQAREVSWQIQDKSKGELTRQTVVALLAPPSTPPAARSELKKLLLARGVRKSISDPIVARVFGGLATPSGATTPALDTAMAADELFSAGTGGARSGAATPVVGSSADDVDVVYIASARDLEHEFAAMEPHFEGKETEHNWLLREKALVRIRGMLCGQAFVQFPDAFMPALRAHALEGIAKTVSACTGVKLINQLVSLRTTVAQQACAVVLELAEYTGSALDPCVEQLLGVLGKMAGYTKRIIAEKSQKDVAAIITYTTCPPRVYIAHIVAAAGEKNVQVRQYCMAHLRTFFQVQAVRAKAAIEQTPHALEQLESCVQRGLADTSPQVRDMARSAFWAYDAVWPAQAQALMDTLDGMARKQLEKANPSDADGAAAKPAAAAKPRATSASSAILAMKRQKAAELAAQRAAADAVPPIPGSPAIMQEAAAPRAAAPTSRVTPDRPASRASLSPASASRPSASRRTPSPSPSPTVARAAPRPSVPAARPTIQPTMSSPLATQRSRSSSLARTLSHSPPSSHDSGASRQSPLRQSSTLPHQSFTAPQSSASSTSGLTQSVRTPVQSRFVSRAPVQNSPAIHIARPLPDEPAGIDVAGWTQTVTPHRASIESGDPSDEAARAQAAQGLSAARQLLDFTQEQEAQASPVFSPPPVTPARRVGSGAFATPGSALGTPARTWMPWQDSPRRMTPQVIDKLQARKSDRHWWDRRQLHRREMEKYATPVKQAPPAADNINADVVALEAGRPDRTSLQRLAMFSREHKVDALDERNAAVVESQKQTWETGDLFDRTFFAALRFLDPKKPVGPLEDALVLLWELAENQWALVEGHEELLVDTLFRLRACNNTIILQGTNTLMSLLTEVSDPLFLLAMLRKGLERCLATLPPIAPGTATTPMLGHDADGLATPRLSDVQRDKVALASPSTTRQLAYAFGLTAMALCILDLPRPDVAGEVGQCEPFVMTAMHLADHGADAGFVARQSANLVLVAAYRVLGDDAETLALFPALDDTGRNMFYYLASKGDGAAASPRPLDTPTQASGRSAVWVEDELEDRERAVMDVLDTMSRGVMSRPEA